jgi:sugar lactone lactonase YvrE
MIPLPRPVVPVLFSVFSLLIASRAPAYTGNIIKSFATPGSYPTGLAYDGKHLWLADYKDDKLYCINPENGEVVRSIPSPAYWPEGLAWDGTHLWCADVKGGIPLSENYQGVVYRLDRETGRILSEIQAPATAPRGLAWDGKYLWCVDSDAEQVIQFSPDDGTTIRSFPSPSSDPRGLSFDGTYLWISDRRENEIYMVDPDDGTVIIITDAPGQFTTGLAWDGKHLWAADYQEDKIFQLTVRDDQKYRIYHTRKAKITYVHEIMNFGPGTMRSADIHLAIPKDRESQKITGTISYNPPCTDVVTDRWGQQTAHYHFENITAGNKVSAEMVTLAEISEIRYFIFPEDVGGFAGIPPDITAKYLENNDKYQYDHPLMQTAVKEAVGDEKNPYWVARRIFNYLRDHLYYEMVGGWNTAPTVLERGNGSCSEYSFVYIGMCRAAGLPARYVGSVVVRGDDASMDDVFHRWVEVYLPNYGWVPVDPSGGDQESPRNQANYFGHLSNRFLITTESGGGSETLEWTYNSNDFYTTDPKTYVVSDNFAEWEPVK